MATGNGRIRGLDLGGFDAESDKRLGEYFVKTRYVEEAVRGRRTIFLGRKGSGKSALFTQLPDLYRNAGLERLITIPVTPDEYAWAALKAYEEQGLLPEQAHTNAWKLTLAIQIASAVSIADIDWFPKSGEAATLLKKFLADNYGNLNIDLRGAATKLLTGLKSFNLSAFGFGVGMTVKDTQRTLLTPAIIAQMLELVGICLDQVGIVVLLDRLDDSWDGSDASKTLLIGLLKAAKDLNDRFGLNEEDVGLKVIVFLRSDIYDALQFDDKDKHRPYEQIISWSPAELRKMVQARLPHRVQLDHVFEAALMRGRVSPFDYIVKRTFLRPREVLQYLDECRRQAFAEANIITKENIRGSEAQYSRWKVEDLKQEFSKVAPYFSKVLECLRQEHTRYDKLTDLEILIRGKEAEIVSAYGSRRLLETLFEASVIGVRLRGSGKTRFKCEDSELALPIEAAVYVHPSLHKGLNITARRIVQPRDD